MSGIRPPVKLGIARFFLDGACHSKDVAVAAILAEYPAEKYVNSEFIESSLISLKAVGILRENVDASNNITYCLTNAGCKKVQKLFPENISLQCKLE